MIQLCHFSWRDAEGSHSCEEPAWALAPLVDAATGHELREVPARMMSSPTEFVLLRHALKELADSSELLRVVEQHLGEADGELAEEEDAAVQVLERYLAALERARRLAR